jgi:hypothetical protein
MNRKPTSKEISALKFMIEFICEHGVERTEFLLGRLFMNELRFIAGVES